MIDRTEAIQENRVCAAQKLEPAVVQRQIAGVIKRIERCAFHQADCRALTPERNVLSEMAIYDQLLEEG
jgi:hypothetical protein